jgi:hypothetical protein
LLDKAFGHSCRALQAGKASSFEQSASRKYRRIPALPLLRANRLRHFCAYQPFAPNILVEIEPRPSAGGRDYFSDTPETGRFESTISSGNPVGPHRRPVFRFEDSAIYTRVHAAGNQVFQR